ncbi:hypothetical protein G6L37_06855 [Agrobacterium rubi]|nr:hypothetical protein [Agrobacterium rubi]NTF25084.1 hypothetical protein [Agrobacterium rubi]
MAIRPSDIRPLELARNSIHTSRQSWLQILFAGGIFVLLAQLIIFFSRTSGIPTIVYLGDNVGSFTMFLATVAVSLVTSARVLGIQIPYLPSALINDRFFWRYVWGALVCAFLGGLAALACIGIGMAVILDDPAKLVFTTPVYAAGVVACLVWLVVYTRLFMLLPAVVVGEKVSPVASWKRTRGIALKVGLAIVLAVGGFVIGEQLLRFIAGKSGDPATAVLLTSLSVGVKLFRCAVEGALAGYILNSILDEEEIPDESSIEVMSVNEEA